MNYFHLYIHWIPAGDDLWIPCSHYSILFILPARATLRLLHANCPLTIALKSKIRNPKSKIHYSFPPPREYFGGIFPIPA